MSLNTYKARARLFNDFCQNVKIDQLLEETLYIASFHGGAAAIAIDLVVTLIQNLVRGLSACHVNEADETS